MNNKFVFEAGYAGKSNYSYIETVSSAPTFYDFLTKNKINVTFWAVGQKFPTYVEMNADELPTGKYFRLIESSKTNEEETGEFIW